MWILQKLISKIVKVSLWQVAGGTVIVIALFSLIMQKIEPETFPRFIDSVWWTMTTIVTVGYGDYFPKSDFGRILTMVFLYTFGIGAMGIMIGKIFESLSLYQRRKEEGKLTYAGKDHYILIGSSQDKLHNVLEEIISSGHKTDIVVIDNASKSPIDHERVHFVSGDPAEEDVLLRANILESKSVSIFTDDKMELSEYADGKTLLIASRVEHISKQHEKSIYTIVEIKKEKHISLFEHANVDEFILSNESVSRLMAHAAIHHGSSKLFKQLLSKADGDNLYEIVKKPHWNTYKDAAIELFEMGATLISDGSSLDIARRPNDRIPENAKLFVICDEQTYTSIAGTH
ncbi:ion transporter [Bacillus canaveralius]|uniref:Ion transporter n=1 Tax=Bacillus canaveralius TaxID=1403243 RepID=A0A2N5GFH5_9BACI|nr:MULTISPECIES: potassium channel family protein [Bacillus]PLR79502.1 ion transporter [Bacillus canaveralius]PLR83192.1 ion transporter [Bacillus sp. V33-4]PLR88600.1 ion transporter [Bacillus canaveralius]RSK47223.1 potassium channel protein [Bacillus canaveralius]